MAKVLKRSLGQKIIITAGEQTIDVMVSQLARGSVHLAIVAPADVVIQAGESVR